MKMHLDFSESKRQLAPEGIYTLRCDDIKLETSKKSGNQMFVIDWVPYNPPAGIPFDAIDRCKIRTWVSLAPNALFTLKNLLKACNIPCECSNCATEYEAGLDECPDCKSTLFTFDPDQIRAATPQAYVKVEKSQDGARDVNTIERYA